MSWGALKNSGVTVYAFFITLAIICGVSEVGFLHSIAQVVADTFIKIFRCISLPVISLSLIVTLSQYGDTSKSSMLKRTVLHTLSTTTAAALVAYLLYLVIAPGNISTSFTEYSEASSGRYLGHLADIVPSSLFAPFIEHKIMSAILVSTVIGVAIRYVPDDGARSYITGFFQGAHGVLFVVTRWVVRVIPLAMFGFVATAILEFREGASVAGIGKYVAVVVLANVIQGIVVLPIFLMMRGISPLRVVKAMMPALSVAFFSKSSSGTLPVTIESAERSLHIPQEVTRFVLPLCTSINMNGCAAFIFTTVVFLLQNHVGFVSALSMLIWVPVSVIAAVGNAGVPMGCFFLSASILTSMGVPISIMGIILPFYSVIDMLETSLNVWSDACVTLVVDREVTPGRKYH